MAKVLEWGYDKALNGIPGCDSVSELAEFYMRGNDSLENKVDQLISWQRRKCFTSGFITGLGGLITLPVAIPANISSVLYVQIRMIAAIAYMGGYDVRDDRVKTMIYACLCGNSAKSIIRDAGIEIGKRLTMSVVRRIPGIAIQKINSIVGFKLLTKFGEKGVVNLVKMIPVAGGIVGGIIDYTTAYLVGKTAKELFIKR